MNSVIFGFDFRSPSTWRGIVWVVTSVAMIAAAALFPGLTTAQAELIIAAGAAISGTLGIVTRDG